jgi:hypothetical protein
MHGENIMAKGTKASGKKEPKSSVKEESEVSAKEEFTVKETDGKGIIDFYYLFAGLGILITIVFIIVGILHFVFHTL